MAGEKQFALGGVRQCHRHEQVRVVPPILLHKTLAEKPEHKMPDCHLAAVNLDRLRPGGLALQLQSLRRLQRCEIHPQRREFFRLGRQHANDRAGQQCERGKQG